MVLESQKSPLALSTAKPHCAGIVRREYKIPRVKLAEEPSPQLDKTEELIDVCSDAYPTLGNSDTEQEDSKVSLIEVQEYNDALEVISKSAFYEGMSRHDAKGRLKWCLPNAQLVPQVNDNEYEKKQELYRAWLRRHMIQFK